MASRCTHSKQKCKKMHNASLMHFRKGVIVFFSNCMAIDFSRRGIQDGNAHFFSEDSEL